jgi:chorismate mutase/prephenate dehydratase
MAPTASELEDFRRNIDEIDDKLQDLLIERSEMIAAVAEHKRDGNIAFYQPGREAEIIRRLVARHRGTLPTPTLVRIWRELLSASVRLEGPLMVAVYAPLDAQGCWDLARDHYGSHTPMAAYQSIGQVIRAMSEGRTNALGVLPMPQEEGADPWWVQLLAKGDNALRVIARLPFTVRGNARADSGDAFVVGRGVQHETGKDRTLLASENALGISRGRIVDTLSSLGLTCTFLASYEHAESGNHLIELDGFVPISDARLERFRARLGEALRRLLPFGGYAVPLAALAAAAPVAPRAVAAGPLVETTSSARPSGRAVGAKS